MKETTKNAGCKAGETISVLSVTERKHRAAKFSADWQERKEIASREGKLGSFEKSWGQTFCRELFSEVFGLSDFRFEEGVGKTKGIGKDWIDCLIPRRILVEMKSPNKNLDKAFRQAKSYWDRIPTIDRPRWLLTCDFEDFRVYDMDQLKGKIADLFSDEQELLPIEVFKLKQLATKIHSCRAFQQFLPTEHYSDSNLFDDAEPLNRTAVEKISLIHEDLKTRTDAGRLHELELFLVRIVFCLFAESRGDIFPSHSFKTFIVNETTPETVSNRLSELFDWLDKNNAIRSQGGG